MPESTGEQGRKGKRAPISLCVCSKWNGKWDRVKHYKLQEYSGATLGHKTDFGNFLVLISNWLLPPQRSHFTSCKSLLLHSTVRQFSFNCPQVVKQRENHCFTQKWVNTNNCFHIPAEWSVWPDITQTMLMALSPTSAEFCSCTSPQNSHLHMPNTPSLSCCIPDRFPLQITITCKYYKRENIQTCSKLVNQLMQRHWCQE